MNTDAPNNSRDEVAELLDKALLEAVSDLPDLPTQLKVRRTFRFGIGMICLAPFCAIIAFFPWPSAQLVDQVIWIGYAFALMIVGAWKVDESSKIEARIQKLSSQNKTVFSPPKEVPGKFRRVK